MRDVYIHDHVTLALSSSFDIFVCYRVALQHWASSPDSLVANCRQLSMMVRRGSRKPRTSPVLLAFFLLILSVQLVKPAPEYDPYKILGVSRSASQTEIKRAYKNLAKEWWVAPVHHVLAVPLLFSQQCTFNAWASVVILFTGNIFNPVWPKSNCSGFFLGIQTRTRTLKLRTCLSRFLSHMRWVNMHHIIHIM